MRVLLIDDDVATLDVLDFSLVLDGHDVLRATDGHHGLALATSEAPDLVILDVMMPGIDGIETLRRLRSAPETEHTPVIMLSAKVMEDDLWAGWSAGADSYITKPLDVELLHAELDRLCTAGVGR